MRGEREREGGGARESLSQERGRGERRGRRKEGRGWDRERKRGRGREGERMKEQLALLIHNTTVFAVSACPHPAHGSTLFFQETGAQHWWLD